MVQRFHILLIILLFSNLMVFAKDDISKERVDELLKYTKACNLVLDHYVDSLSASQLTENALQGMLGKLDPHSSYLSAQEVQKSKELLYGRFVGIGVRFQMIDDTLNVIGVIPGGPAEKEGLKTGDKIIEVNDVTIAGVGMPLSDIQNLVRGESGSKVDVSVKRDSTVVPFRLKRAKVKVNSVSESYLFSDSIGYIKIDTFGEQTHKQATEALENLMAEGAKSFIIDVRSNSGGFVFAACELLSQFLPEGALLLKTCGRGGVVEYRKSLPHHQKFVDVPVVVLVDGRSASASEIVAGAFQDWDRGVIVGSTTYGKGLVQQPYSLGDGSEIRVTISRYHTPCGRSIQKPYKDGKYVEQDSTFKADSLLYKTILTHRNVYASGGVEPDIKITNDVTPTIKELLPVCTKEHHSLMYVLNREDPVFLEAVRILSDKSLYYQILENKFVP